MSRIDIEGALPLLSEEYLSGGQMQSLGNERQKQQFSRYFPPRSAPMRDLAQSMTPAEGGNLMQTDYHIISGPLSGVRVHVCLVANGLHIVLSHSDYEWVERLQRLQTRWQRQLHQWGFPCLLEVTHAGDIVG